LAILFEIIERIVQCNLAFSGKLHKLRLRHATKLRRPTERDRAFADNSNASNFATSREAEADIEGCAEILAACSNSSGRST
jgi:hypothetical protein